MFCLLRLIMALDFQQVRKQVIELGESAPRSEQRLKDLREKACGLLKSSAGDLERLRQKVQTVVQGYDASLRCGMPVAEPLDASFPLPPVPARASILAADGSQIAPDRHSQVDYCLVNVGAIRLVTGASDPPETIVDSKLMYDDQLYTPAGLITEARLALLRDLNERKMLARMAMELEAPVAAFTDGQIELWLNREAEGEETSEFQRSVREYTEVLTRLCSYGVALAGYVDKPASDLVVRLLEVAMTPEDELGGIRQAHRLRGVKDSDLFNDLLAPGERSALFEIQSRSAQFYQGQLALHFFYLNVGRPGRPWIARVEVPAWVAREAEKLDLLHAVLVQQCRVMGSRPYPYLLHRAHEAALVSLEEKEQLTQMIVTELHRRGVRVGDASQKQSAKDLSGRTRYQG